MNTPDPQDYAPICPADAGNTSSTGIANTVNPTALTNNAYLFLEQFEGVVGNAYPDGYGYPTVGIGFLLQNSPIAQQAYLTDELGIQVGTAEYNNMVADLKLTWHSTTQGGVTTSAKARLQTALNLIYGGTIPALNAAQEVDMWNRVVLTTIGLQSFALLNLGEGASPLSSTPTGERHTRRSWSNK